MGAGEIAESRVGARDNCAGASRLELVIVSYRSRHHIEEMLASLGGSVDVVVVDNAANVDGLREWAESRDRTRYVDGGGRGFARAANLGARTSTADVVAFVNPDARPTLDVLTALADDVIADARCASSAALTVGHDGTVETGNGGWEPTVLRAAAHTVGLHKLAPRVGIWARPERGEDVAVHWTTAACMAVRRETFLRLGGFDEGFFVYCEDIAFGRTAREAGLYQRLRTDRVVTHSAGSSGAPSLEMMQMRGAMLRRYVEAQRGRASASVMTATLAAGFSARSRQARAIGDAALADEHAAYARGLRSGRAFVAGTDVVATLPPPRSRVTRPLPPLTAARST